MEIRIRETGQVMTESEFRVYTQANGGPTWDQTTPEILQALNADVVLEGPQAQPTRYQTAYRDGVEQIDGQWFTKWSVADMDDEAKAAAEHRRERTDVRERRSGSRQRRHQRIRGVALSPLRRRRPGRSPSSAGNDAGRSTRGGLEASRPRTACAAR